MQDWVSFVGNVDWIGGTAGAAPATAPAQFGAGDWSVADAGTSGDINITITTLPDGGGSAITDLEYQIDAGAWVSLGGTTTGVYGVAGLTDDVEVTVAVRAVNAVGNGTASAGKTVTPTDGGFVSIDIPFSTARSSMYVPVLMGDI